MGSKDTSKSSKRSRHRARFARNLISCMVALTLVMGLTPVAALADPAAGQNEAASAAQQNASSASSQEQATQNSAQAEGTAAEQRADQGAQQKAQAQPEEQAQPNAQLEVQPAESAQSKAQPEAQAEADADAEAEDQPDAAELLGELASHETQGIAEAMALVEAPAAAQADDSRTQKFTIAFPSTTNDKRDLYAQAMYSDNYFSQPSSTYRSDLAFSSICFAASAFNSNLYGDDYYKKTVNVRSFIQNAGGTDIALNEGFRNKPMDAAPVGVAIANKRIRVNDEEYKLIMVGVRGGNYEREWAGNVRVGASGNHQGFEQARDEVIARLAEYIDEWTKEDDKLKVWIVGYSRGAATANMVGGMLSHYVSQNGEDNTNGKKMTVWGWNYDKDKLANTTQGQVEITNRHLTPNDIYCYPVNPPQGVCKDDAATVGPSVVGVHNLVNPDDWIPQVAPSAWGFSRYGVDHDLTGTYAADQSFAERPLSIRDAGTNMDNMFARLKAVDPTTTYVIPNFRQYFLSKKQTVAKGYAKTVVYQMLPGLLIPKIFGRDTLLDKVTETLTITTDSGGEGNFYTPKSEFKHNPGAYYTEFIHFFLDALGVQDRAEFAARYQQDFEWVASTVMGMSGAQFNKLSAALKKASSKHVPGKFTILINLSDYAKGEAKKTASLVKNIFIDVFADLQVSYDASRLDSFSRLAGEIVARLYAKEQSFGMVNFYHLLTMGLNGGGIGSAHYPEVNMAYFKELKPAKSSNFIKPGIVYEDPNTLVDASAAMDAGQGEGEKSAQIPGEAATHVDAEPVTTHMIVVNPQPGESEDAVSERSNGEILGVLPTPDALDLGNGYLEGWALYNADGVLVNEDVSPEYVVSESDPEVMVLVPKIVQLWNREVRLYADPDGTYSRDNLVAHYNMLDGGYVAFAENSETEEVPWAENVYTAPERAGYYFDGWRTAPDEDGESVYYRASDIVDDASVGEEGLDLFASWEDNAMWISNYYGNYPEADPESTSWEEVAIGDKITVRANTYERPGYTFTGWNTKPDGSGVAYAVDEEKTLVDMGLPSREESRAMVTGLTLENEEEALRVIDEIGIDLYAQWKKDEPAAPSNADRPGSTPKAAASSNKATTTAKTGDATVGIPMLLIVLVGAASLAHVARRRREH